jgi:hypothetical protein
MRLLPIVVGAKNCCWIPEIARYPLLGDVTTIVGEPDETVNVGNIPLDPIVAVDAILEKISYRPVLRTVCILYEPFRYRPAIEIGVLK